jgi:hypothetical protein
MILADKVAVATDVAGVSCVLLLSGQTLATPRTVRTPQLNRASAGRRRLMTASGYLYLPIWLETASCELASDPTSEVSCLEASGKSER